MVVIFLAAVVCMILYFFNFKNIFLVNEDLFFNLHYPFISFLDILTNWIIFLYFATYGYFHRCFIILVWILVLFCELKTEKTRMTEITTKFAPIFIIIICPDICQWNPAHIFSKLELNGRQTEIRNEGGRGEWGTDIWISSYKISYNPKRFHLKSTLIKHVDF